MMSIHTRKAREKAASMGAFAGEDVAEDLWELPKRELIEIALWLSSEGMADDVVGAVARVLNKRHTLKRNGII